MSNGRSVDPVQPATLLQGPGQVIAIIVALLPATAALLLTLALIVSSRLEFDGLSSAKTRDSLILIVVFALAGLAVGHGVRRLLPPDRPPPPPQSSDCEIDQNRDRLARYVVTAGTIGIFVTALSLIIAIAMRSPAGDPSWKESMMSIFTSVLPVFSTWVGTVLAFYFTNETVRRTQQSQRQGVRNDGQPIRRPGTMISFENIPRIELDAAAVTSHGTAAAAAGEINLGEIQDLFGPTGTNRVVIFDEKKAPVFVLQRSGMPPIVAEDDTVEDYLATGGNLEAATKFAIVAADLTIASARQQMETDRLTDLFVTEHGSSQEPTLGWVPDENLRGA